ncbi:hypothetical protein B6D51_28005 [Pseudomonas chlororaphis subsp. chlororaphis]|nr:hypothetical protein B6D51_28005 [Pseudomonas chlororaphis subsp. chlororaphis]
MHRVKADSESCGLDRSLRQLLRGTWVAAAEQREAAIATQLPQNLSLRCVRPNALPGLRPLRNLAGSAAATPVPVAAAEQREAAIGNAVAAKPELAVRQAERVARLATAARSNAASQARQRLQGLDRHGVLGQTSHAT